MLCVIKSSIIISESNNLCAQALKTQVFNSLADTLCMASKKTNKGDYPLNERIKYLRELRKMTQSELAKKAGITQGSLAHFESGKNSPSVQTLMSLARALEISPAIFFTNDEIVVFDLKKIQERYKTLEDLPDKLYRDLNTVVLLAKKLGLE
jgi:transcriptional regulator with XRE-family HTH domain